MTKMGENHWFPEEGTKLSSSTRETTTSNREDKEMKYKCNVCGYVYDPNQGDAMSGVPAKTPFENLPEDWVCPVCGATKDEFSPTR